MKKIFAICFYFILCFDKYCFNSVGDKVDYVREILKNQKKIRVIQENLLLLERGFTMYV